ncbi:jg15788, partial [Pararge aegeria aegeria]
METNFNGSVNPIVCVDCDKDNNSNEPFISFVWYITLSCVCFVVVIILMAVGRLLQIGQKTRTTQQRRTFIAPRQRPSVSHAEPTIYVSPANLPPPPKY